MASRKKRTTTKSKRGKARATTRKKTVKRVAPKETKRTLRKPVKKTRRGGLSKTPRARQQKPGAAPLVEQTVIDVVDEPVPGVVRITEIEEVGVAVPDLGEQEEK